VASAAEDLFGAARDYAAGARERANGDPGGGWGRAADGWPEAVPLLAEAEAALPYPVDALPPVMRAAVTTYQAFGRQPVAMVASSALAAASLACQGLADVDRDGNLAGPCSLSFLSVGLSGERKTSCDRVMARGLRRWEREERGRRAPGIEAARGRLDAWQARRDGVLARIKRLSGSAKAEDEADRRALEADLEALDRERPRVPPEAALFKEDVSPEALAVTLAEGWPSSSLWSDEGGLVVGGHAMGRDSAMRFLALLNRLWDGSVFDRRRTTRESVRVEGRRLTVSLMVQPAVLAELLRLGGGIARGTGNLARFLVAWPESTMGTRLYRAGDPDAPELRAFDDRLAALLALPLPIADPATHALEPPRLRLSRAAFEVWRELADDVERSLGRDGEYGSWPTSRPRPRSRRRASPA
jgi:putative DNA primase/helicase